MQNYINSRKVTQGMTNMNWDALDQYFCVNECYEQFRKRYTDIIEASTTTRKEKIKNTGFEWMTWELKQTCRERDRLYTRYKNNRRNQEYEKDYKIFQIILNKRNNATISGYYKEKFQTARANPKETWKLVNQILGRIPLKLDDVLSKNFASESNIQGLANKFATQLSLEVSNICLYDKKSPGIDGIRPKDLNFYHQQSVN